jgi:hypothetical protein
MDYAAKCSTHMSRWGPRHLRMFTPCGDEVQGCCVGLRQDMFDWRQATLVAVQPPSEASLSHLTGMQARCVCATTSNVNPLQRSQHPCAVPAAAAAVLAARFLRGKLNSLLPGNTFGPQLNFIGLKTQDWVSGPVSELGWVLEKPPTAVSPLDLYTAQKLTRAQRLTQPPSVVRPMGMCAAPTSSSSSSSPRPASGRRSHVL